MKNAPKVLMEENNEVMWDDDPQVNFDEEDMEAMGFLFEDHSSRVKDVLCEEKNTQESLIWDMESEKENGIETENENEIADFLIVMAKKTSLMDDDHSLGVTTL